MNNDWYMSINILWHNLIGAYIWNERINSIYVWGHKVWPKRLILKYNLDLENGQPIGRMHDWELRFRVNVKDANEPFKIAVNWYGGTSYDRDISVDWAAPVRYQGGKSETPIQLSMPIGKHYVKITPHGLVKAGWARCLWNQFSDNLWNDDLNKLSFSLERLPWYSFMESENNVGDWFLSLAWQSCPSLISMPNWFDLPQNITILGNWFLASTWLGCTSLTSFPEWFNLPQSIRSIWNNFLQFTWKGCSSLSSLPKVFDIPQMILNIWYGFMNSTWEDCASLTLDSLSGPGAIPYPLRFPNIEFSSDYWWSCFWWTCPIEPDDPKPWDNVMIKRNS